MKKWYFSVFEQQFVLSGPRQTDLSNSAGHNANGIPFVGQIQHKANGIGIAGYSSYYNKHIEIE